MLLSSGEKKRSNKNVPFQKVIIPKGMINPDETTVIEIPARLHKQPIVVAKHKTADLGRGLLCGTFKNQHLTTPASLKSPTLPPSEPQLNINQHRLKVREGVDTNVRFNSGSLKNLNATEERERAELQKNLEAFQKARRKLLENTTKLATNNPTIKIGKQLRI
ncbi:hypothetical protein FQR65_LT08064 [Abscondita terminalis]|nr:hypothetical protein FQR65_LT08064 [Abscondita terminalis]